MVSPVYGAGGNSFPSGRGTPVQKCVEGGGANAKGKIPDADGADVLYFAQSAGGTLRSGCDGRSVGCHRGRVTVGPGTLYHLLDQFLHDGMIEEMAAIGRKRSYRLTEKGQRLLEEEYGRLCARVEDYRRWMRKEGEQ